MERTGEYLAGAGLVLVMAGPAVLLLLLKRWSRRWWVAILGAVVISPPVAFFAVGGVAYAAAYHRVVVEGDTAIPDREGMSVKQYLSFTFAACGGFGVGFAGLGLMQGVPAIILWRFAHVRSFKRFTRMTGAVEQRDGGVSPSANIPS